MKYILLILLIILLWYNIYGQAPDYNRKYFTHWIDVDRDCQNTRQEVLIEESKVTGVIFADSNNCRVTYGIWRCMYDDTLLFNANDLDVDHVVSLKSAWISGAYKWDKEKRKQYANYMKDPDHLIAVTKGSNRSKGAKSPDQWMPKNPEFKIPYCKMWCKIKVDWGLTATRNELAYLNYMLRYEKDVQYPLLRDE